MRALNPVLFFISLTVLLVAFSNRNDIPADIQLVSELAKEPVQRTSHKAPFSVDYQGVTYEVEPRYSYDLYGHRVRE